LRSRLIVFVLSGVPESARIARLHVRTALGSHGLTEYAEDAETITSELVTNAVQHARGDGTETIGVTLARASAHGMACPLSAAHRNVAYWNDSWTPSAASTTG
jgi:hypothetical protein